MIDIDLIIKNIKQIKNLKFNKQVAEMLGLSPADFSIRKKRGTLLHITIQWALDNDVSIDWLLTGKEKTKALDTVHPLKKQTNLIHNFNDEKKALDIIIKLSEIEKISRETYGKIIDHIELVYDTAATVSRDILGNGSKETKKRNI